MRVLILGGTLEARIIATKLANRPGTEPLYSLAGRTQRPTLPNCPVRQGGFGGADGLARYLRDEGFAALVDATHPYAARMAENARRAAAVTELPLFRFLRPPWEEPPEAPWLHAATPADAAMIVRGRFRRVFLSSGLGDAAHFADIPDCWFLIRTVDPPASPVPLAACRCIVGRGPFDLESELDLLRDHRIDAVISKNSGGDATVAKLRAARELDVPVIMIDRPPVPDADLYTNIDLLIAAVQRVGG